jgi:hypothetical protein
VQVWQGGRAVVVHGVHVDSTSLAAIPYHQPLACDSCRMVLPRSSIDSVRVGSLMDGFWRTTALVLGTLFTAGLAVCYKGGCGGT